MTYFLRANNDLKIGFTKDFESRLNVLQTGNQNALELVGLIGPRWGEWACHQMYAGMRVRGEWYRDQVNFKILDDIAMMAGLAADNLIGTAAWDGWWNRGKQWSN